MGYNITNSIKFGATSLDANSSLNVSNKTITGNYVQDKDNHPLDIHRVTSGTATQTWSNGVVTMSVGAGEYAIAQTYRRHPYFAGKSVNVQMTFNNMGVQSGVEKRIGYFSSSTTAPYTATRDGIYLEMDGTTHNLVVSKGGTEIASVARASWDDPMDGTGPSGQNIDLNNFTVVEFQFLYLGGTAVEMFFNIGGTKYVAHTYKNSSVNPTTFVNSPIQPLRWEIHSSESAGTLGQICGAASIGGTLSVVGNPFAFDLGNTVINANNTSTSYLVAAMRLNNFSAITNDIFGELLAITNDKFIARFYLNPSIAGTALTWNALPNTGIDYAIGDTANPSTNIVTGGTILSSHYGASTEPKLLEANSLFRLGVDIDGNADILALAVQPLTVNLDILGSLNFKII